MEKDSHSKVTSKSDASIGEMPATDDNVSRQRRKLLRASAAVPAIMTLRSGVAAATSLHDCIVADAQKAKIERPDNVLFDDPDEIRLDEWLRYEHGKAGRRIVNSQNNNVFYAIRTQPAVVEDWDSMDGWTLYKSNGNAVSGQGSNQFSAEDWSAATDFYCFPKDGSWMCLTDGTPSTQITVPLSVDDIKAGTDVALLVYLDITVDPPDILAATAYPLTLDGTGTNITNSCWSSVNADNFMFGLG